MRKLTFLLCSVLETFVYFTPGAHFRLDWQHFQCSITMCVHIKLDSTGLECP